MNSPFFTTREDRVSLAKIRYFEDGILPTGVVSEAVFQSWARCQRDHKSARDKVEFQHVSQSRSQLALQKNRELQQAWLSESNSLLNALGMAQQRDFQMTNALRP
jgi:sigma-54 dependent transcriptional regulator, acetoin dehydrogenase operon transcriptional activator AcoR